jgi:hypothetical protein
VAARFSEKLLALVERSCPRHRLSYGATPRAQVGKGRRSQTRALQDAVLRCHPEARDQASWGVKHHLANVDFIFAGLFP